MKRNQFADMNPPESFGGNGLPGSILEERVNKQPECK